MKPPAMLRAPRARSPSRTAVAWAVLGAAVGVSLTYSGRVYSGEGRNCFLWYRDSEEAKKLVVERWGEDVWSEGSVRILGFTVYDEEAPRGEAPRIVDRWHQGVAIVLGLMGAAIGLAVHQVRRRAHVTSGDLRLWMPLSTLIFAGLVGFGVPGEGWSLGRVIRFRFELYRRLPAPWLRADLIALGRELIRLGLMALLVGWVDHRVLLSVGVRLPRRAVPDQAADYDDRAAPAPAEPNRPSGPG